MSLILRPLKGVPLIHPGDSLDDIILSSLKRTRIKLAKNDILVLTQKIVSKAEDRLVNLSEIVPSAQAIKIAQESEKDARLVELILRESKTILRVRPGLIIVEHKCGFICANAGIDHSNVCGDWGNPQDWVSLLPEDSDRSAKKLQDQLEKKCGLKVGILIIDSHGRAWRMGTIGTAIGVAGVPGLVDLRGKPDLFGYQLRVTQVGVADELASAASLIMGQAAEGSPIIHVRGFPYPLRESSINELLRPKEYDLFR